MKFLFCADLHLRNDKPVCRTDEDWLGTQQIQLEFIANQAIKSGVDIVIGGDIFHTPTVPDRIKNIFLKALNKVKVYAITGQHCLPSHSLKLIDDSSFGTLLFSDSISSPDKLGEYSNYNEELQGNKTGLLFLHKLVFANRKDMPPNSKAIAASELLKQYPDAKWIFLGDVHTGYHIEIDGRHVIMAGSMNRQTSDMKNYQPVCWYIDTDKEIVEKIPIPDDCEIVDNVKIKEKEELKSNISSFMELLKESKSMTFDYKYNVKKEMPENTKLTNGAKDIVREYLNEEE